MGFGHSKNKKKENIQKENEINKEKKKIDDETNVVEMQEEINKLKKDLTQKNEKEEQVEEEEEEDIYIEKLEKEKEEGKKIKEEKIIFKNDNEAKHLEVKLKIKIKNEKDEIYKVYELSDNRIAVELNKCIKIYSLKTCQLITEIKNNDYINSSIELKNKDIAITNYSTVYFYKLSDNNYINYLKLEEKEEIYEIYELKNENLILCPRRCLKIYKKENGEYKFLSKFKLNETVGKILEIKNNIVFLFLLSRANSYATADYSPYSLLFLNLEKKQRVYLGGGCFSRYNYKPVYYGCKLLLKNNKYLFARYANSFCIYDIENDDIKKTKCIFKLNDIDIIQLFHLSNISFPDYDDDSFIILSSNGIYKYDEIENKIILKQKINNKFEKMIDILKLKNNNFIIHNKNEILLINN